MKNNIVQIYLGSKDCVIDTWFDLCKDQNTSYIVQIAMLYYFKTGEYLPLGNVSIQNIYMQRVRRVVYLSQELKELREYIGRAEEQGEKLGALFKRVLRQGIETDSNKPSSAITEIEAERVLSKLRSYNISLMKEAEPQKKEIIKENPPEKEEIKEVETVIPENNNVSEDQQAAPQQGGSIIENDFMLQFLSPADINNFSVD